MDSNLSGINGTRSTDRTGAGTGVEGFLGSDDSRDFNGTNAEEVRCSETGTDGSGF